MRRSLFFDEGKVIHKIFSLVCAMVIICSCNSSERQPDVSGIQVNLQSQRLDKDLAAIDTNNIGNTLKQLKIKYPDFLDFYLDTLMGFGIHGSYSDTAAPIRLGLRIFLTQKDYRGLLDTLQVHFPDTKNVDEELVKGFKYMKYYYPQYKEPHVIYLETGLKNWGAFTVGSNTLGIGLDMFLGTGYPFYKSVGIPEYMNMHLSPKYIPVAAFSAIYTDMHPIELSGGKTLLDLMLQYGKMQYFLHKVLPFTEESTRFGYTDQQLDWCEKNEATVYNFFVREDLIYATEYQRIIRYVTDGPNSTGMPQESPGNIGSWLGYRIVSRYMQEHPETTLEQLFKPTDAQQFLAASKYKPK